MSLFGDEVTNLLREEFVEWVDGWLENSFKIQVVSFKSKQIGEFDHFWALA